MAFRPTRSADELRKMLIERIEAIPALRGQITDVHRGGVVGIGSDGEGGPTWTVPVLTDRSTHRPDIARIIRQLQMQYDLDE
jgi:hypothetical protein